MSNSVLRYEVPLNDEWHEITSGWPLHVATRKGSALEFWALERSDQYTREYRVFGTGHPIEDETAVYVGTTFDAVTTALVWHLFIRSVQG